MSEIIFYDKINGGNKAINLKQLEADIANAQDSLDMLKQALKSEIKKDLPDFNRLSIYTSHLEAEAISINNYFK